MKLSAWSLVFISWLIAACSALVALFLGEVMGFAPCTLCWYQRMFMFPLVFVLAVGLVPFDPRVVRYSLPLAMAGLAVAVFHLMLMAGVIPQGMTPCHQGVPCDQAQVQWFGFITIPLLSAFGFFSITLLLIASQFRTSS